MKVHDESTWPEPDYGGEEPDDEELERMIYDGVADATDGCIVEPDGVCEHGHPSWLRKKGLI